MIFCYILIICRHKIFTHKYGLSVQIHFGVHESVFVYYLHMSIFFKRIPKSYTKNDHCLNVDKLGYDHSLLIH